MVYKLYEGHPHNPYAQKVHIAAALAGVHLEIAPFDLEKDGESEQYLAKVPTGKVPALETPWGTLFESNAILRFIARLRPEANLYGSTLIEQAQVDQWLDFAANEIEVVMKAWIYPILGYVKLDKKSSDAARESVLKTLGRLNDILRLKTFLVGQKVTIADIALALTLAPLYKLVLAPAARAPLCNVTRYFLTCVHQPAFAKVLGEVKLADKEQLAAAPAKPEKAAKESKESESAAAPAEQAAAAAAEPAKKADKKKKKKDEDEEEEEEDEYKEKEEAPKEETEEMKWAKKPSKMVLDDVKKLFSNNPLDFCVKEFWNTWDPEVYTLWEATYKYNAENEKDFLTSNLIEGFIQRLDKLRKVGFGVINMSGTGPYDITCGWLFKWKDIPSAMTEVDDYAQYDFKKIDGSSEAGKQRFVELFSAQEINGKKLYDRWWYK